MFLNASMVGYVGWTPASTDFVCAWTGISCAANRQNRFAINMASMVLTCSCKARSRSCAPSCLSVSAVLGMILHEPTCTGKLSSSCCSQHLKFLLSVCGLM